MEWWQGSLFYEIFPASFQDSYNNDGIGDLRGITDRLDYLENLGVKGIRLNSIFSSKPYPQNYKDVQDLTEVDPHLGTLADFDKMVSEIHKQEMALILDLPLHPLVKSFGDEATKHNLTDRHKREENTVLPTFSSRHEIMDALSTAPGRVDPDIEVYGSINNHAIINPLDDNAVTKAIRFWHEKGVDGFYLKGLEHYTNETNFVAAVGYWKSIIGTNKILMCSEIALQNAPEFSRNVILNRMDLVDVILDVENGTKYIKHQVLSILKGSLFQKAGYPWVHWSTGNVDTPRLASTLKVANASVAIAMMGMMLPGTPSIFYGDEVNFFI